MKGLLRVESNRVSVAIPRVHLAVALIRALNTLFLLAILTSIWCYRPLQEGQGDGTGAESVA